MKMVFNVYKATEGGIGQKFALGLLKDAGISAKPITSIYVGQTAVIVEGNQRVINKAERILYGG